MLIPVFYKGNWHAESVPFIMTAAKQAPVETVTAEIPQKAKVLAAQEKTVVAAEHKIGEGLIGIGPVIEFLITVLWTAKVKGERPVSVILVAAPGHGKTSILMHLLSEWTHFTDDLTSREFSAILGEYPQMTHLLLGDMTSIFNRKNSTSDLTCNILRRAIEEGVEVDSFSGKHFDGGRRRIGFITAIPPTDLHSRKISEQLEEGGFASRFIVARYAYSQITRRKIHEYIRSDAYTQAKEHILEFDDRQGEITIPSRIANDLHILSMSIKRDPLGARAHHHLRALAKASALEHKREVVNEVDFRRIEMYADFFTAKGKVL
jgi:hypothetical protein